MIPGVASEADRQECRKALTLSPLCLTTVTFLSRWITQTCTWKQFEESVIQGDADPTCPWRTFISSSSLLHPMCFGAHTHSFDILAFFSGDLQGKHNHDQLAQQIAEAGQTWARQYWRYVDMQACQSKFASTGEYFGRLLMDLLSLWWLAWSADAFRLYLEWARLSCVSPVLFTFWRCRVFFLRWSLLTTCACAFVCRILLNSSIIKLGLSRVAGRRDKMRRSSRVSEIWHKLFFFMF